MSGQSCLIDGCQARVYAPAGTRSICKDHFLGFLTGDDGGTADVPQVCRADDGGT